MNTRRWLLGNALLLAMATSSRIGLAAPYQSRIADANHIGVTLTNYGVLGNSFISRSPSLEYPLGTGYEHVAHAGLWVGATATDAMGSFTGVTTAMLDATVGFSATAYTEFSPAERGILVRSRLVTSPYFDPAAISDLDVVAGFDDVIPKTTSGSPEAHRPMNIAVRQISHQWSGPDQQDFAIERYMIRNIGPTALTQVHIGMYSELASGPKNAYSTWPPSAGGSPLGTWWGRKFLAWDGPQRLLREHRCTGPPYPAGCQFEITPAWVGIELLTPPTGTQRVTVAIWNFAPFDPARDVDTERHAILSAGVIADVTSPAYLPGIGDPVELLALGPFPLIAPGDSIEVAFALVGGSDEAAILHHANEAQRLHDAGYNDAALGVGEALHDSPIGLSLSPLPSGGWVVTIDLPGDADAKLDLIDVTGRSLSTRDLGRPGQGRHEVRFDEMIGLPAGIYFLNLRSAHEAASARIVMLR